MRFWAGVTDNRWFEYVSRRQFDEVNFWQPSAKAPFSNLPAGTPFLFKLKKPNNCIAGGGYFVRYTRLPLLLAWDTFTERNGASSLREFRELIKSNSSGEFGPDPDIGCTVVTNAFFLPREKWISVDALFPKNIMQGKTYDTSLANGSAIWAALQVARIDSGVAEETLAWGPERFGKAFLMRARLGQGSFRTLVIDSYQKRCAITGESTLPVLEAAHIKPYAEEGPHLTSNGLLLRSDFHKLFDAGLVTVEPDHTIRISSRIRDQYFNGKAYYRLHGQKLALIPEDSLDHPSAEYLRWHNNERFAE